VFVGSAQTYRLGDAVTVELVEAAPVAGALRFRLVRNAPTARLRAGQAPPQRQKSARRKHPRGRL